MSKKKSFSGSTMTLKDFHGGSIPSDLPLPSAPGVVARPSDRSPFDRQIPTSAWGNPIGRQDHRSRPGSSGATRSFDEKAAFLSHPPHIGRNFDEDERKPFDGGVAGVPRRSVREDDRPPSMGRSDNPKPESGRVASPAWPASAAALQSPVAVVKGVVAANLQIPGGNGGASSTPNAWGVRKEVVEPVPPSSALSGQSTVSKFAQASALEKISSGRWQSKPALASVGHHVADVEVISYSESEAGDTHFGVDQLKRVEYDGIRGKFGEGGGREFSDSEWGRFNRIEHDGVRGRFGEGGGRDFSDSENGMAVAGLAADGRQIVARAKSEATNYESVYGEPIPVKELADRVASYVHLCTLYWWLRPFGCGVILGGYDRDGPQLYMIEPSGVSYMYFGAAIGKGRQGAKTDIEKLKLSEMTCREGVIEVAKIIYKLHDEAKDKAFELEMSWVCDESKRQHEKVPDDLLEAAKAAAKAALEEMDAD